MPTPNEELYKSEEFDKILLQFLKDCRFSEKDSLNSWPSRGNKYVGAALTRANAAITDYVLAEKQEAYKKGSVDAQVAIISRDL